VHRIRGRRYPSRRRRILHPQTFGFLQVGNQAPQLAEVVRPWPFESARSREASLLGLERVELGQLRHKLLKVR